MYLSDGNYANIQTKSEDLSTECGRRWTVNKPDGPRLDARTPLKLSCDWHWRWLLTLLNESIHQLPQTNLLTSPPISMRTHPLRRLSLHVSRKFYT